MEQKIHLADGSTTQADINGISRDGTNGHALLVPSGDMSLAERLAESVEIRVTRDAQGTWHEIQKA